MFQKALVIGSPGAGKSTFARKLRDAAGLPLYHLDMLWLKPDRTTVSREEFDQKLAAILAKDRWVIDGNYLRTMETRLKSCDAVFFLDLPAGVCLAAAERRIGIRRDDLPWVEESLGDEFRQYILDFPHVQLPAVRALLEKYRTEKTVITFRSWPEADNWLSALPDN